MDFSSDDGAPGSEPAGRPRCGIHGIALDDEFHCTLCRRAAGERRSWSGAALLAVVVGASLAAYVVARDMTTDPLTPTAVVVATPASTVEAEAPANAEAPHDDAAPLLPRHHAAASTSKRRPTRMPQRIGRLDSPAPRERRPVSNVAIEAEMQHVPIVMYATRWCPYCAQARKWLSANGYRYAERDVDGDASAKEARDRLVPSGGVPVFTVGNAVVNGFSAGSLEGAIRREAKRSLER